MMKFSGVKVFSATLRETRDSLGETITAWIRERGDSIEIVDMVMRQSSDNAFHLVSCVVFYNERGKARIDHVIKAPSAPSANGSTGRRLNFNKGDA